MTAFTPSPDTERDLRTALGRFATGITVVTCASDAGPVGMTVNSFTALSLDPPLLLWCPAKSSLRYAAFAAARFFSVHVLGDDQHDLCRAFVKPTDGFADVAFERSATGVPQLGGCLARFDCAHYASHDAGDHQILIGRIEHVTYRNGAPLIFSGGQYGRFAGI